MNYTSLARHCAFASILLLSSFFVDAQTGYYQGNVKVYSAQMHLHSWSNHNGSDVPASVQMNSYYAQQTNTKIIWWTEHRAIYNLYNKRYAFTFRHASVDSTTLNVVVLNGNDFVPAYWLSQRNTNNTHVSATDTSFTVSLAADSTKKDLYNVYSPEGTKGALRTWSFARCVADGATLHFLTSNPTGMNSPSSYVRVQVQLSYHIYGNQYHRQNINYHLYNVPVNDTVKLINDSTELIARSIHKRGGVKLNLLEDAVLLPDYKDNCLQNFSIGVAGEQGATPQITFSDFYIESQINDPQTLYTINKQWDDSMAHRYHIIDYIAMEFTPSVEGTHLSAFLPDTVGFDPELFADTNLEAKSQYALFSQLIQKRGGLVTIDHPFGCESDGIQSDSILNYRIDTTYRYLKNNYFFGTHLVEVGYRRRGGCDLSHYLTFWDKLNSSRAYMYGEGVSDEHGGNWVGYDNDFVNFIWSPDSSQINLMKALRGGRFFFGDDQQFRGNFYFRVGNAVMGDSVITQADSAQLKVFMTPQLRKLQLVVTEALINADSSDSTLHYILNSVPFDSANAPRLDISRPCFVRVEALDSSGNPVIMSNPIFFSNAPLTITQIPVITDKPFSGINIYPNPAGSGFTLNWSSGSSMPVMIKLADAAGKTVKVLMNNSLFVKGTHYASFSTNNISAGLYYIEFSSGEYHSALKFIIK